MLFSVVLVVMVVIAMVTVPGETSTQATSVEMEALLSVTMAMVVQEEMPLVVSPFTLHDP